MTWAEVIRNLKAAGFIEARGGKVDHRKHLGNRILREAGVL
jgi:hypothetical protein